MKVTIPTKFIYSTEYTWKQKHFWWCWFWQFVHKRESADYDGVCMNCRKDRYTGKRI